MELPSFYTPEHVELSLNTFRDREADQLVPKDQHDLLYAVAHGDPETFGELAAWIEARQCIGLDE